MAVIYCEKCDKLVDLDYEVEHPEACAAGEYDYVWVPDSKNDTFGDDK